MKKQLLFAKFFLFFLFFMYTNVYAQDGFEWVVKPGEYEDVRQFTWPNSVYSVQKKDKWGVIDKKGNKILPCEYDSIKHNNEYNFSSIFGVQKGSKWAVFDTAGTPITKWCDQVDVCGDYAIIRLDNRCGIINTQGLILLNFGYNEISNIFFDGFFRARKSEHWAVFDGLGKQITQFDFDAVLPFTTMGVAPVKKDGKWGGINMRGQLVIPCEKNEFDSLTGHPTLIRFENRLYNVQGKPVAQLLGSKGVNYKYLGFELISFDENQKVGIINTQGQIVQEPIFDAVFDFKDADRALVAKDSLWGYIDPNGALVIVPMFQSSKSFIYPREVSNWQRFHHERAVVKKDGMWAVIGKFGEYIIPFNSIEIEPIWGKTQVHFYVPTKSGEAYIYDKNGTKVLNDIEMCFWSCGNFHVFLSKKIPLSSMEGIMIWDYAWIKSLQTTTHPDSFSLYPQCWRFVDQNRNRSELNFPLCWGHDFRSGRYVTLFAKNKVEGFPSLTTDINSILIKPSKPNIGQIEGSGILKICLNPQIAITNPSASTTLPGPTFPLKACITSNCSVSDVSVYINGVYQQTTSAERDFILKGNCEGGRYFERLVTLPAGPGPHKVVLSVTTPAGTFTAERIVSVGAGTVAEVVTEPEIVPQRKPINERRLALVIGNELYKRQNTLPNTSNDADSMQVALEYLNFKVMKYKNLTKNGTANAIDQFQKEAATGYDVVLVYYSGHGVSLKKENYLIPTDEQFNSPADADYEFYALSRLREKMEEAKVPVKIIIWDACRDVPQLPIDISKGIVSRGLEISNRGTDGFFEAYATAMGQKAQDYVIINGQKSKNSPYTTALLQHIRRVNISISDVFTSARATLSEMDSSQQAGYHTYLSRLFYLNPQ
jgi:hypothetical protein